MNRRSFLVSLGAACAAALALGGGAEAGPRARRARRRRVRRRVRRRHRRHAFVRVVNGRSLWVVPLGVAVGWELVHEDRVVVVKETRIVEKDEGKIEVVVVQHADGKTEEVEMLRENTTENAVELEGSLLSDDDKKTPGVEAEIEEQAESEE